MSHFIGAEQEAFVERTLKQFEEVSCLRLRKWKPYDPDYVVITVSQLRLEFLLSTK